jgi:hypothetical protein
MILVKMATPEELQALREEVKRLRSENAEIKEKYMRPINFAVNEKGQVCVHGIGKYSCNLYRNQWNRIIEKIEDLKKFMEDHDEELR